MQLHSVTELLGIPNYKVAQMVYQSEKRLGLMLQPIEGITCICSGCGKVHYTPVHSTDTVVVEDLPISGKRVFLYVPKQRSLCLEDDRIRTEEIAWLRGKVTRRFADHIYRLTSITTNTEAGWFFGLDDEKVYRIDKGILEELSLQRLQDIPAPRHMSVDEVAWKKWHKYATNVVDVEKRQVIWNHNGRGKTSLDAFHRKLGKKGCSTIEAVASDGARGFLSSTDEAGVRSDHHAGTTWAVKGKTPVVSTTGARFSLSIISAVSAQGEVRFMTVKGRVGASQFIEFIKRLLHGTERMIFLIVDGYPAHKAKSVAKFIETQPIKKRFRLFFLPPYSPELNPDERVWNDLKNNAIGQQAITAPDQVHGAVIGHLRFIQKSPDRVRSYFNNATTKYAV